MLHSACADPEFFMLMKGEMIKTKTALSGPLWARQRNPIW